MKYIIVLSVKSVLAWFGIIVISTSIAADEIDMKTVIAGIKYYDSLIESGRGDCILEKNFHLLPNSTKAEYLFVFDGIGENRKMKVMYQQGGPKKNMTQFFDGEKQWEIYDHEVEYKKMYGVRHELKMGRTLDPGSWLTYGSANYETEPLWKLLERYECKIIGMERLNDDNCYVIQAEKPSSRSFKIWIAPQKGFRPIKIENRFVVGHTSPIFEAAGISDLVTNERMVTKELTYQKYADRIWFLQKGKTTYVAFLADPENGENTAESEVKIIRESRIELKDFKLNIDVSDQLRLNIPNEVLVFDHSVRRLRPATELLK